MGNVAGTAIPIVGFGGLGIILALILKTLNDNGILIDEMITGTITITDVMVLVITLFLLIGVIIAAVRR